MLCAGCDSSSNLSRQEKLNKLPRIAKHQLDQFRGDNCLRWLPSGLVAPKRFSPDHCKAGRVDFSLPDKLFEMNGLDQEQHRLIVTGPDGDSLLTQQVDLSGFERPEAELLPNGLIRIRNSGVMGFDPVLRRDIIAYLFLHKSSGGLCRSANMSMEPRTFMVLCWQRTPNATVIAFGPEGEAATVLRNLRQIAAEIDPSI